MKPKLFLDCDGFALEGVEAIRSFVHDACQELEVSAVERRSLRQIDPVDIGNIYGLISAVCAVVGLALQLAKNRRVAKKDQVAKDQAVKAQDVVEAIRKVETKTSIEFTKDLTIQLKDSLTSTDEPQVVVLATSRIEYKLSIHREESVYIRGRVIQG